MTTPILALLAGGTSAEREVSLGSGAACLQALARCHPVQYFEVNENSVPKGIDPARHVVFSTLHGTFGEDGGMQRLLDAAGIEYAGCDAGGSELTMDKSRTKAAAAGAGLRVIPEVLFKASQKPTAAELIARLGGEVVLKPNDQGSSVGLCIGETETILEEGLAAASSGNWLAERRIRGRELSVGVLGGKAMGVVEIRPKSGVYDYTSKYTKGMTEYFAPAPLSEKETAEVRTSAEKAFAACGCRDYARVDFIFSASGELFLLEINTLPGMKETSLLPMSARCTGLDFTALVCELVAPALKRFHARRSAASQ